MARHTYPHAKDEPGLIAALDCHAPCGGWVVLYDRKKGALKQIKNPVKETGRFILVHRPSGRWTGGFQSEAEARGIMRAAAKGEDPNDILPKTVAPAVSIPEQAPPAPASRAPAPARPSTDANIEHNPPPPPAAPEKLDFHTAFKREVQTRLTPKIIVDTIESMLNAKKTIFIKDGDGNSVPDEVPDWQAIRDGVKLAAEYGDGQPLKRPETKEQKKVTFDDIRVMCFQSPAARRSLRKLIDEEERRSLEAAKA